MIHSRRRPGFAIPSAALLVVLVAACAAPSSSRHPPPPGTQTAGPVAASASAGPTTVAPSAAPTSPTQAEVERLLAAVAADPDDAAAQRDLGFALLQRIRETADPTLYGPATDAFDAALRLAPDDALVHAGIGGLRLGQHQFAAALESGRTAARLSPSLASARVVIVDALVELGRYDEADEAASEMLALSQDLSTLARVSYLAELRGDLDTALAAMRAASRTPGLAPENTAYVLTLLANLERYSGEPLKALDAYDAALASVPGYAPALAGKARLAVGEGDLDRAIELFRQAADVVPLPEYVIALGDAQSAAGRTSDAERSLALARAEIQLLEANGVAVDVDLALFEADHGDAAAALDRARAAHAATPTVRAADAVAWSLHRLDRDDEAKPFVEEALRLGSRDPLIRYHAGAIEAALGDVDAARRDLQLAIDTDPGFSASGAADARRLLEVLGG